MQRCHVEVEFVTHTLSKKKKKKNIISTRIQDYQGKR